MCCSFHSTRENVMLYAINFIDVSICIKTIMQKLCCIPLSEPPNIDVSFTCVCCKSGHQHSENSVGRRKNSNDNFDCTDGAPQKSCCFRFCRKRNHANKAKQSTDDTHNSSDQDK